MKRAGSLKLRIICTLSLISAIISTPIANADVQFATTMSSTCSTTSGSSTWVLAIPFTIPEAAVIKRVDWKLSSGPAPTTAFIKVLQDSAGAPTTSFYGVESYTSFSNNIATFSGTSINLPSAGTYWLAFFGPSSFQACFSNPAVTTGTPSGWTVNATASYESYNTGALFYVVGVGRFSFLFTLYGTGGGVVPPSSSIAITGGSLATFRLPTTLTASLGVAGTDGKVTFYANGKKIPGCISKSTVSLATSCSWRPSTRGSVAITARLVPTDSSYGASTSLAKNMVVSNRSGTR